MQNCMKSLNEEDRARLKDLMADDRFEVMRRLLELFVETRRNDCESQKDDIRFHQGRCHGVREILRFLHAIEHPEVQKFASDELYLNLAPKGFRRSTEAY